MARPKSYPPDLREQLITAAADALTSGARRDISLRDLAASVGTSTNAIYALFGGKQELISAVAAEGHLSLLRAEQAVLGEPDPLTQCRLLGVAYRDWALENPGLYKVVFGHPTVATQVPEGLNALRETLHRLFAAYDLDPARIPWAHRALWGAAHGWIFFEVLGTLPRNDAGYRQMVDALLAGLIAGAGEPGAATRPLTTS